VTELASLEAFSVKQRITLMVNRYEIRGPAADGGEGPLIAVAQQKRMAFKEQVTFFADEARTQPLFGFTARQRLDLGATYDVVDGAGQPIGWFRKKFGASLLRSTWTLGLPDGRELTGTERNPTIAIARRLWEFLPVVENLPSPFVFHVDFVDAAGTVLLSSERQRTLRDRYEIRVPSGQVDGRLAAAMAVALDALQSR